MTDNKAVSSGKNIVIFSDGTGQEGGLKHEGENKGNTNIHKIFSMLEDRTNSQVAFYDQGLGTGLRKISGSIFGAGISKNILECYQFISDQYQVGDRIFLFGFSRGATTVRSLAGFIALFGILPHSRPEVAKWAYDIYKESDPETRKKAALEFLQRNNTVYCNIEFVGVWDTVSALGVPSRSANAFGHKNPLSGTMFHDLKIPYCVHHAYHAMAIDEQRTIFKPELWKTNFEGNSEPRVIPPDLRNIPMDEFDKWFNDHKAPNTKDIEQTVKQVWFCGVHTDVGGGYKSQGLSDIPLGWMLGRAKEHGLKTYPFHGVEFDEDVEAVMHNSRLTWKDKIAYGKGDRQWDAATYGKPIIHASVLERNGKICPVQKTGKSNENGAVPTAGAVYDPWILNPERGGFKEDEYIIESWEVWGQHNLNLNIEHKYRSEYDGGM